MRWIKRLVIAVIAFVAVAIGLLFMLPTERIGELASDQLQKQTGRTLTLSGDFSPTLYPTLGVKTGRVTISNADWATEPVMISADGAAVGVNLMALIGGSVEIEKLDLIAPVVYLERAADGRVNWDIGPTSTGAASGNGTGSTTTAQPTLELGTISDGQVIFNDRAAGTQTSVTDINGSISLPKASAAANVDLSAKINGQLGAVDGTIDDLQAFMANKPTSMAGTVSMGGSTIKMNGTLGLTDALPIVDATFDATVEDLSQTAKLLQLTLPEQAKSLSSLGTSGQLRMDNSGLFLDAALNATYAGQPMTGKITATGAGDWTVAQEFNTDLSLTLTNAGKIAYNGRIKKGSENTMDGDFSANFSDLRRVMGLVGADPATPAGTFKTASMKGTLALTPAGKYRLRSATLQLDQNTLNGAISITPRQSRPLLLAQLRGGALDLRAYTADNSGGSSSSGGQSGSGWSKDPISLQGLDAVDADVDLRAKSIDLGVTQLGSTDVTAKLRDGLLSLALKEVRAFKGGLTGNINLRGGKAVAFDTTIRANGVQLEPLLGQLLDMDRLRGAGNTDLVLKGRGTSLHQIMSSLSGNGTAKFTDGAIKGIDLAAMMRNLQSAFGGFEGATEFTSLDGTFSMDQGVLQNIDLSLISPLFKAGGKGSVDIGGQAMNYVVTPTSLAKDAEFSVPVIITGPWNNLKFRPDVDKLLNLLLDSKLEDSEEVQKIKTKIDEVKDKLKNPEDLIKRKLQEELGLKPDPVEPDPVTPKADAELTKAEKKKLRKEQKKEKKKNKKKEKAEEAKLSAEDEAKEKLEEEVGNALKKLFD